LESTGRCPEKEEKEEKGKDGEENYSKRRVSG